MYATTLARKEEEEKTKSKKKIRPQTHKHTGSRWMDGWMDGWTNVELLILPNFSLSPGHSPVKEKKGEKNTFSHSID
jgi:hypothetical protein